MFLFSADMPRKPWERTNTMNGSKSPVIGRYSISQTFYFLIHFLYFIICDVLLNKKEGFFVLKWLKSKIFQKLFMFIAYPNSSSDLTNLVFSVKATN